MSAFSLKGSKPWGLFQDHRYFIATYPLANLERYWGADDLAIHFYVGRYRNPAKPLLPVPK
jgi:hypothetical protein